MLPWNQLPFNEDMKKKLNSMNPNEIDKYVQNMVLKMFPKNMEGMLNPQEWLKDVDSFQEKHPTSQEIHGLQSAVFETHDFVFIRIQVKDENWLREMKIYHTSHEAIIENIPEIGEKHTLKLPAAVKRKGAVANHRDGVLEVRIPRSYQTQISEINIQDN